MTKVDLSRWKTERNIVLNRAQWDTVFALRGKDTVEEFLQKMVDREILRMQDADFSDTHVETCPHCDMPVGECSETSYEL